MKVGKNVEIANPNLFQKGILKGAEIFGITKTEIITTSKGTKIKFIMDDMENVVAIQIDNVIIGI